MQVEFGDETIFSYNKDYLECFGWIRNILEDVEDEDIIHLPEYIADSHEKQEEINSDKTVEIIPTYITKQIFDILI